MASARSGSSLRARPRAIKLALSASERSSLRNSSSHFKDVYELDEVTRDGDSDLLAHFPTADTGAESTTTTLCVRGTYTVATTTRPEASASEVGEYVTRVVFEGITRAP